MHEVTELFERYTAILT